MKTEYNKQYRLLGINDEATDCTLCGRKELKQVWWLENTQTQEVFHVGCDCARKLLKIAAKELKLWQKQEVAEQTKAAWLLLKDTPERIAVRNAVSDPANSPAVIGIKARLAIVNPLLDAYETIKEDVLRKFPAAEKHRLHA